MDIELRQFVGWADWDWVNSRVGLLRVEDTTGHSGSQ